MREEIVFITHENDDDDDIRQMAPLLNVFRLSMGFMVYRYYFI